MSENFIHTPIQGADVPLRRLLGRRQAGDEGAIAIMAALIIPVVLLVLALALASLVWGTSETETQRASDQAALQAAASLELVPSTGLSVAPVFPTLNSVIPSSVTASLSALVAGFGLTVNATSTQHAASCATVGNVYTAVTPFTNLVNSLTASLLPFGSTAALNSALGSLAVINPSLASALQHPSTAACTTITVVPDTVASTRSNACAVASAAMASGKAPWSNNFFGGTGSSVPDCDTNQRVSVALSDDGSNLLDLGGTSYTTPLLAGSQLGGSSGTVSTTSTFNTVQTLLTTLGVRLQTALPNSLCPTVTVGIDQPVKAPVYGKVSVPNGRSTAKRVVKNVVIVPVFNGVSILSPNATVNGSVGPSVDLNTAVLGPLQPSLISTLDAVNGTINQKLATANTVVSSVSGAHVGQLDLLSCLIDTVSDIYDPPTTTGSVNGTQQITGSASQQATTRLNQVLTDAAASGDPVQIVQVGVRNCAGDSQALAIYTSCIAPALGTITSTVTGLYDVPFLDVTPALIRPVTGSPGDFQALPVAASQASGAFRSILVRGSSDDRYLP
jgi:hypothetical protein